MTSSTSRLQRPAEDAPTRRTTGERVTVAVVVALIVAGLLMLGHNLNWVGGSSAGSSHTMPQNPAMEDQLGIRFSQVAVVGDGGLLTVTYVVLDSEKAAKFQADTAHPPILKSERRKGQASRVSLMKQGHTLRAGQKYYLVYQNPADLVRHNEKIEIDYGSLTLKHVPVW